MKKITKITQAQIDRFPEWVDKWVKAGLSTEPADWKKAEKAILQCYQLIGRTRPKVILRMGSPYGAVLGGPMAVMLVGSSQVDSQVRSQVDSQVYSQVYSQVRSQVDSQVHSQVYSQVYSQVRSQVYSQVHSQVRSQVDSQVHSQVDSQVHSQVHSQVYSQVYSQVDSQVCSQVKNAWYQYRGGNLWAAWYAWISFYRDVMGWEDDLLERYAIDEALALSAGWTWWHEDVCAISDRPIELHKATNGLHCETGPAILWRDGYSLYALNGVRVPEWLVKTPAEEIDLEQALKNPNVELRREVVRKVGAERIAQKLNAKTIDQEGDYELLEMPGLTREPAIALKMKNPSIGVYHIEFVPFGIKTVAGALNFRNGTQERPVQLT